MDCLTRLDTNLHYTIGWIYSKYISCIYIYIFLRIFSRLPVIWDPNLGLDLNFVIMDDREPGLFGEARGGKESVDGRWDQQRPSVPKNSDSADPGANNRCYQLATLSRHKISRKRVFGKQSSLLWGTNNSRRERMKPCIFIDQVYPPRFSPRVFVFSALAHLSNPNRERNTTNLLRQKITTTTTTYTTPISNPSSNLYHSYQASRI